MPGALGRSLPRQRPSMLYHSPALLLPAVMLVIAVVMGSLGKLSGKAINLSLTPPSV